MATKKVAVKRRTKPPVRRRFRHYVVKRELLVLSHTDTVALCELVNAQLARSVEPDWESADPATGVEVELDSRVNICAPNNLFAVALEFNHWEMHERKSKRRLTGKSIPT